MIEEALRYADLGWPVFPLTPGTKIPLKGSRGVKDCSIDPVQIKKWWAAIPKANIGLGTGFPSGIIVIDVDVKNGAPGLETISNLRDENGQFFGLLSGDLTCVTPTGGFHIFFSLPNGVDIGNSAGKIGPGVDVRGTGGYVVAAPSETPEGYYKWGYEGEFPSRPREIPRFMIDLLAPPVHQTRPYETKRSSAAPRGAARPMVLGGGVHPKVLEIIEDRVRAIQTAPQGTRNDTLNSQAFYLARFARDTNGISVSSLTTRLMSAAMTAGIPMTEAMKTIDSALKRGMA